MGDGMGDGDGSTGLGKLVTHPPPQHSPAGGEGGYSAPFSGPSPVPWIADLEPAVHGSFDQSAALDSDGRNGPPRTSAADVLDFSANGNVIGPPPGVLDAVALADISRYPDRKAWDLRRAIAQRHGVPASEVVVGNGSTELIWAVARAYLAPGHPTLVLGPTYGEYAVAAGAAGAAVHTLEGARSRGPALLETLARGIQRIQPRLVWLCHPNNPTGAAFPIERLPELVDAAPHTLFVVDEAYLPLADGVPSALPLTSGGQVIVLRSMTKDAALAGLRIGYAIAAPPVADAVGRAIPPWTVSSVAQAAGQAAIADTDHGERVRVAVATSRALLMAGLQRLGLRPYPSVANFVLVPVGDARAVTRALLERGYAVRDCTSFGLPDCIRIGVRAVSDQNRLLGALARVLGPDPRVLGYSNG